VQLKPTQRTKLLKHSQEISVDHSTTPLINQLQT